VRACVCVRAFACFGALVKAQRKERSRA